MKTQSRVFNLLLFALFGLLLSACNDDMDCCVMPSVDEGFFVVNEGAFQGGNASLSFFSETEDMVQNGIFQRTNNRPLGDQAQSMAIHNDTGFIVVQNSGTVEVINPYTFTSLETISTGLESPRYFLGLSSSKAYVSDWGPDGVTGTIKIINLENMTVTGSIPAGAGPNRMISVGDFVYVTLSGGFGLDNRILIINSATDEVTGEIEVGDNPNSIVVDSDNMIWVISGGYLAYNLPDYTIDEENSTYSSLSQIDTEGNELLRLEFEQFSYSTAANLVVGPGDELYYTFNDNLYRVAADNPEVPAEPFISQGFYGLAVHPQTGNIYGCNVPSFSAAGSVIEYGADGNQIAVINVGVAPNSLVFR